VARGRKSLVRARADVLPVAAVIDSAQQFAITPASAIANVSTVGWSQVILLDGSSGIGVPAFTPGAFT